MHKTHPLLCGLASASLLLLLTACAPQTIVKPERVEVRVPVYVPINPALTRPVAIPMLPAGDVINDDLADLAAQRGAAIEAANAQLAQIRKLQPTVR